MKKNTSNKIRNVFLSFLFVSMTTAAFASVRPYFEKTYRLENVQMNLKGKATKHFIFRPVFVSGLYMPSALEAREVLANRPKRLEVHYLTHISKSRLTKYTIKKMKDNLSEIEFFSIAGKLDEMDEYFVDLSPGDRFAITYIPGVGTKFEHNGALQGVIPGEEFAKGIFSVWLGQDPMDEKVKREMLGLSS